MSTSFLKFTISSTLEYSADHFTLAFTGSEPFRTKTKTDTVDITIGLLDSGNNPVTITFLDSGPVDEFEITITPNAISGNKRGRDQAAFALDRKFLKRYYRSPNTIPVEPPKFDSFFTPIPPIPATVGVFNASFIAKEAAAAAGLKLNWGIPDYQIQENFFASGRAIDTIRKLVAPWQLVAPFQADVYVVGNVLTIKQRRGLNPLPDYTISMADMKRETAVLRVRKTQKYGLITLTGAANALQKQFGVFVEGQKTLVDTQEAFDPTGLLLSRVITTSTYATPSNVLLDQIKETYTNSPDAPGVFLTRRDTTTNDWEVVAIDTRGPITQKKHISQTVVSEGFDDNNNWQTLETSETGYSYDGNGFETGETTVVKKLDTSVTPSVMSPDSMTIKTMRDVATLIVEQVTEVYGYTNEATSAFGGGTFTSSIRRPFLQTRDTQQQSGTRPGGPGRAQPFNIGDTGGAQMQTTKLLSTDPNAVDVQANVFDLTVLQVRQVLAQYQAASFIWEYEAIFTGVNMPWIQRGQYLKIENIPSEVDGTFIDVPTMLVLEANAEYDESTGQPKSTVQIRCFGWSTT